MAAIRLSILLSFLTATLAAQWLNYRTPGVPRDRDGKPNLSAPAPRMAGGKPDLSGVWMHEFTSAAEIIRLYGALAEEFDKTGGLGMEIGTQHKYVVNILLDSDAAMLPGGCGNRPPARRPGKPSGCLQGRLQHYSSRSAFGTDQDRSVGAHDRDLV